MLPRIFVHRRSARVCVRAIRQLRIVDLYEKQTAFTIRGMTLEIPDSKACEEAKCVSHGSAVARANAQVTKVQSFGTQTEVRAPLLLRASSSYLALAGC